MDMRQFFNYWQGYSDRQREKTRLSALFALQLRVALNQREVTFEDLYPYTQNNIKHKEETPEEFKARMSVVNADFESASNKPQKVIDIQEAKKLGLI